MNLSDKQQKWKLYQQYIYDYVLDNNLDWPCTTCCWGPIISENSEFIRQKVYFACRTDGIYSEADNTWQKLPSFLVVASVDIPQPGKCFNQELRNVYLQDNLKKHKNLKVKQIINHPGDANMMKKCSLNHKLLATKNDSSQVYLWDLDKYKVQNQFRDGIHANVSDLILIGHTSKTPSFALDWSKNNYRIGSGGKDQNILIWDVDDYQTRLSSNYMQQFNTPQVTKRELNSIGNQNEQVKLKNNICLTGHTDMIEDLSFSPVHKDVLVSVGDDKRLLGWDIRTSSEKQFEINDLHTDDINCVDWSLKNENYVATGSSDGTAALIDIRKMKKIRSIIIPSNVMEDESNYPIMSIRFSPGKGNYLGVGSDNIYLYNLDEVQLDSKGIERPLFTHFGQKGVINDFDWNTENPWSILSTCQELEHETMGGGSLQAFRPLDLMCMPKEDALKKLKENLVDIYQKDYTEKKASTTKARNVSLNDIQKSPTQRMEEEDENEEIQDDEVDEEEEEDEAQDASNSNGNNQKQFR